MGTLLVLNYELKYNLTSQFQVIEQIMDEKLGRMATRVVLPRVVMHSRYHYAVIVISSYT